MVEQELLATVITYKVTLLKVFFFASIAMFRGNLRIDQLLEYTMYFKFTTCSIPILYGY